MKSDRPARDAALATTACAACAAALLGATDVALRGAGLSAGAAAASVLLWLALAAAPAALSGAAVFLLAGSLRERVPAERLAAHALAAGLVLLALFAFAERWIGLAGGAALALGALAAAELTRRFPVWLRAAPGVSVAVILTTALLAALLGALRSEPPRLPGPASDAPVAGAASRAAGRPHVVLIVLDTLRADHLGSYGHRGGLSPAFDALASEGTLYERCYSTASWTVPSHASLFTGLYPGTHGASFEHHRWLDDDFTTLAEALRAAGYRTAGFAANAQLALTNLDQGFELYREIGAAFRGLALRKPLAALGAPTRWIDDGAAQGVEEIEDFLESRKRSERPEVSPPLFLFVNLLEPHWRYLPPFRERRAGLPRGMSYFEASSRSARFYGPLAMARSSGVEPRTRDAVAALYAAEVRYQDAWLGRLVRSIDRTLGAENTLIIVTADHGENLGEGGRWDHVFAINDHLIHVPMLLRRPSHVPAGRRESALCQLIDVPATVAGSVGELGLDAREQGRSLLSDGGAARAHVFAEGDAYLGHLERMSFQAGFERDVARFDASLQAVHDGRFKYVTSTRTGPVLHDLDADPDETRDARHAHPEVAAELARVLADWRAALPRYVLTDEQSASLPDGRSPGARPEGRSGITADERERLESLGYVQ